MAPREHGPAAGTRPAVWRRVEQVMGMPVSLALRGRHAGDRYGEAAWARALAVLHEADRVFSTYRADSFVSRLGRGEIKVADCPAEVVEELARGQLALVKSGGASGERGRYGHGRPVLDPS